MHGFIHIAHKIDLELSNASNKEAIVNQFKDIKTREEARAYLKKIAAKLEAAKK